MYRKILNRRPCGVKSVSDEMFEQILNSDTFLVGPYCKKIGLLFGSL